MTETIHDGIRIKLRVLSSNYEKNLAKILKLQTEIEHLDQKIKFIHVEITRKVLSEKNEDGKAMYSNQAQRDMAQSDLLNKDAQYQSLKSARQTLDAELKEAKSNIELLKFMQKNSITIAQLQVAETNLVAAEQNMKASLYGIKF